MNMDFIFLLFDVHSLILYQCAAIPFSFLFYYLCRTGCLPLISRYIYLMLGGFLLAVVTMGPYCLVVLIPAVSSVLLIHFVSSQHLHTWAFLTQMGWQTSWHLLLQYREYQLQEGDPRLLAAVSSLMLLTQRVTSLSLDIQEGKLKTGDTRTGNYISFSSLLPYLSYLLYFPALLGGPLCSFRTFTSCVKLCNVTPPPNPQWTVSRKCVLVLGLEGVKTLLTICINSHTEDPMQSRDLKGVLLIWSVSLLYKMTYYSYWVLSELLNNAAGFGFGGYDSKGFPIWNALSDADIWTLETTHKISQFARTWNKTTADWLRRLVFEKCKAYPLLATFAFSAWWHGLHPGQVFGFLCWAATVEADYRVHYYLRPYVGSGVTRLLYKSLTWVQTQLVIACCIMTVELRSLSSVRMICQSYISLFPLLYCLVLVFVHRKHQ
ncbi:ghrelin O-acyltransferase-like [Acipenser ruthenus]|nr:ghrelin O-acyltransferase-like [Acipenser ruthenus]XP_034771588.2 ghrelin O-acyltransferase-like [Acipenser ruthenus]